MSPTSSSVDRLFQALGDPTRLRIATLLADSNTHACVCELTDALAERQYNISRHLKALRAAGLVAPERDGRWVYYRLNLPAGPLGRRLSTLLRSLPADPQFSQDRDRLAKRLALRKHGRCCVWTTEDVVA